MHLAPHPSSSELCTLLRNDHDRLERLYRSLMAAFEGGDRPECERIWTQLERGVLEHLETEEEHILPEFRRVDYAETLALLGEHEQVRANLADLGVGIDLHLVRADVAKRFVDDLLSHAARENRLMYRWLAHDAPAVMVAAMFERVRARLGRHHAT